MMDEEIRQALNEVREMKQMCGNINMKLTNIVTQRGQNWKAKLEAEYQRGLSEGNDIGYKDGVKDGQNEAWECAKKIALMDTETSENVTGYFGLFRIMENLTPMQAIEKLKAYEDDKIKRGDIVNVKGSCNDDLLGVVTKVWEDNCYIMWGDGSGGAWSKDSVVKTGKHIDVDKFFEEIAT